MSNENIVFFMYGLTLGWVGAGCLALLVVFLIQRKKGNVI